jgi:hypothetical protein
MGVFSPADGCFLTCRAEKSIWAQRENIGNNRQKSAAGENLSPTALL